MTHDRVCLEIGQKTESSSGVNYLGAQAVIRLPLCGHQEAVYVWSQRDFQSRLKWRRQREASEQQCSERGALSCAECHFPLAATGEGHVNGRKGNIRWDVASHLDSPEQRRGIVTLIGGAGFKIFLSFFGPLKLIKSESSAWNIDHTTLCWAPPVHPLEELRPIHRAKISNRHLLTGVSDVTLWSVNYDEVILHELVPSKVT